MNPDSGDTTMILFDLLLALSTLVLAIMSLRRDTEPSRNPSVGQRRRIILFMAFGLLLALIWARLAAPDVAIAEAAIGAGFAGALLLTALKDHSPPVGKPIPGGVNATITLACALLAAIMGWAMWRWLWSEALNTQGLAGPVYALLPDTGVSNPVTGVLLNLRAFDTLLELAVLLAAAIAITGMGQSRPAAEKSGAVLNGLVRWLAPMLLVTAGYLLWTGAKAPGGAFQAGALVAAAGVVLHLAGHSRGGLPDPRWQAWLSVSGVAVFLLIGIGTLIAGQAFLGYRGDQAGALILLVEGFATVSIGTLLVQAYLGGLARGADHSGRPQPHPFHDEARRS